MLSRAFKAFALALGLTLSACATAPAPAATVPEARPPLRFGAVPTGDPAARRAELSGLAAWLERSLGVPVEVEIPADYRETARRLAQGEWDLALLGPVLYSRAHEQGYAALAMPVRGGASVFSGVIIARRGSPLATLADLEGKRIGFVDASSSAGFQYPIAHLLANGLTPADFERVFVGGHRAVVRQVLEGKLDAGACYEGAIAEELSPEEQAGIAILARTEPVPGDVLAARAGSPHFEALRRALSSLQGDDAVRVLGPLHAEGLAAPDERLFDSARRVDLLVSEEAGL